MSSTVLSPRIEVDSDALDVFSAFARMRGLSVGEALADYVNSFRPKSSGVRVVGRDADGPIFDIPDEFVYTPEYAADGAMILPGAWADDCRYDIW